MNRNKGNRRLLQTDQNTTYLFDYMMNEDKFNEQMRPEWDDQANKKINIDADASLNGWVKTEQLGGINYSSSAEKELPSTSESSGVNETSDSNISFGDSTSSQSVRVPYSKPMGGNATEKSQKESSNKHGTVKDVHDKNDTPCETPEGRRARGRDMYAKLQDLEQKGIILSRKFYPGDDPDNMEEEYTIQYERRNKNNQVKFYKQMLLNIICGVEFLNDKYDPFEFKLKDWSKHVASEMDDYTEVLEEIYEKYKDKGGKMPPEIRLLFIILMSGVTYHLSQTLFGSGGLKNTINKNPNLISKLMGGMMGGGDSTPENKNTGKPNNSDLLRRIKENRSSVTTTEGLTETTNIESESDDGDNDDLRNKMGEQNVFFRDEIKKQQDNFNEKMEQMYKQNMELQMQLKQTREPISREPISREPISREPISREPIQNQPKCMPMTVGGAISMAGNKGKTVTLQSESVFIPDANREFNMFDEEYEHVSDIEKESTLQGLTSTNLNDIISMDNQTDEMSISDILSFSQCKQKKGLTKRRNLSDGLSGTRKRRVEL
jgi:hypothetical protein